jgi:putative transposase
LCEAKIVIESWRRHYNAIRPHASLGYQAPAPEVFVPALAAWPAAQLQSAAPATLLLHMRPKPKLTSYPDHSVGADHSCEAAF